MKSFWTTCIVLLSFFLNVEQHFILNAEVNISQSNLGFCENFSLIIYQLMLMTRQCSIHIQCCIDSNTKSALSWLTIKQILNHPNHNYYKVGCMHEVVVHADITCFIACYVLLHDDGQDESFYSCACFCLRDLTRSLEWNPTIKLPYKFVRKINKGQEVKRECFLHEIWWN